jgi:hypothetical protein
MGEGQRNWPIENKGTPNAQLHFLSDDLRHQPFDSGAVARSGSEPCPGSGRKAMLLLLPLPHRQQELVI